jgi:tetratricopeptide (TPR) repeat protein
LQLKELDNTEVQSEEIANLRSQLESLDSSTIWSMTAVPLLHQDLRRTQTLNPKLSSEILDDPIVKKHLPEAYERFCRAEALCSLLPHTSVRLAQLEAFSDYEDLSVSLRREKSHIKAAVSRAIPRTQTLFRCGLVALNSGDQELAVDLWKKCLRQPHSRAHEKVIIEFSLQLLPMKTLYEVVLPQEPEYLLRVARRYMNGAEMSLPKKFLVVHLRRLIEKSTDFPEFEKKLLLAQAAGQVQDYYAAAEDYRAALSLASLPAPRRYDYAFALFKTKQFDEAVRQLKVCELDPSFRKNRIRWLLDRIRKERSKQNFL